MSVPEVVANDGRSSLTLVEHEAWEYWAAGLVELENLMLTSAALSGLAMGEPSAVFMETERTLHVLTPSSLLSLATEGLPAPESAMTSDESSVSSHALCALTFVKLHVDKLRMEPTVHSGCRHYMYSFSRLLRH